MSGKYLTTGQAAARCSVSPDTVLKWIRSGLLLARRTAGGHHRIDENDLEKLLEGVSSPDRDSEPHAHRRQFQYCWEYNGSGQLLDRCKRCSVYLMRAQRCYEVAKLAPEVGPPKTFCIDSCEDCDFFRLVQGQRTSVLVVTDDSGLTRKLREAEADLSFNLEIANCEYACSTVVNHFRPDFAIVDCSLGTQASRDIAYHLIEDPRAPFVRVVLAGNEDEFPSQCEFPDECEIVVYARLSRPFGIDDINECIEGIKPDAWEVNKRM